MKGIIAGLTSLINIFKMLFNILMNIFGTIALVFGYLISIVNLAFTTILTLPNWLKAFAIITIAISICYIIIGRNIGKSD